jgi:hypothetical protein
MVERSLGAILAMALVLSACSSRPRQFTPELALAPADQGRFDTDYSECRQLYSDGKLTESGRLASGAAGAAAGAAVAVVGGAAASSAGFYTGMAVAGATVVALPFVAVASAWGLAKSKKKKKEKAMQIALSGCLEERGYQVSSWKNAPRNAR